MNVKLLILVAIALIPALQPPAYAQTAKLPEFEVASIKPVDPSVPHMVGVEIYPGARIVMSSLPLKTLVAIAFRVSYWQISGGDAWTEKDSYDIQAKPPENLLPGIKTLRYSNYSIEDQSLREMLQALLIDRFQLKFHRETKTGNVYLLQTKGDTLRLRQAEPPSPDANPPEDKTADKIEDKSRFGSIGFAGGRWGIFSTSMPQLAKFAADNIVHAPVMDRTGLSGLFDYRQPTPLPDSEVNYRDPSDSFLGLIPELGLKLERAKGPVETFVIDRAEKPSPN